MGPVDDAPIEQSLMAHVDPATVGISGPPHVIDRLASLLPVTTQSPEASVRVSMTDHDQYLIDGGSGGNLTPHLEGAIDEVLALLNRRHIELSPSVLHLHAGAVATPNGTLVISGPSGSGKSTLVAALCERGGEYLTDECVDLGRDGTVRAWLKPISLRPGGQSLLSSEALKGSRINRMDGGGGGGAANGITIVVLDPEQVDLVRSISPTEVLHRLVDQSLDFGRRTGDLAWLGRVVASAPAISLGQRDLDDMCVVLAEVPSASDEHDFASVELVSAPSGEVRWHAETEAIRLAGALVIFNRSTKMIATIDGTTGPLVDALNSGATMVGLESLGTDLAFVEDLIRHGFIVDSAAEATKANSTEALT